MKQLPCAKQYVLGLRLKTFFLAFDFCRFCMVIRFFIPATTANDLRLRRIEIDFIHYIYFPILILEKEPVFPFWMLHKGTTGTIFTSLVWRGPWLGIEPGNLPAKPALYH